MPTYDYECKACEHRFETFQSMTSEALRKCPVCGKRKLRRIIGPGAAIVFKGSGFYKTDYRSESYRKAAAADSGAGAGTAPPAGTGADAGAKSKEKPGGKGKSRDSAAASP